MQLKDNSLLKQQCYIGGEWRDAFSGETIPVYNPATGEIIAYVPKMCRPEAELAIDAADNAFKTWKKTPNRERARILKQWQALIIANQDDLAKILCLEQGKPFPEARKEILHGANYIEWFAEEAKRINGDIIPAHSDDKRALVTKEPIGVCAALTPWNFPNSMITRKTSPALAAGCTFVIRPASQTPLSALALAELAHRAGLPAGVFNVITGTHDIGDVFTTSPVVRKFSFTGSTAVGSQLMARCAGTIKKVSLELGGNAPFIVFDDADMDAAIVGVLANKFRNAGQTCVCANRIYVQSGIYDTFIDKLTVAVKALKVGHGFEEGVVVGPLIDQAAVHKVQEHIQDALDKGAKLVLGGQQHALGGLFFEPTILSDVTQEMKVAKEETFGPLAPIFKFDTEEEVIDYANATIYGLAAYFFSRDLSRVFRVSEALEYGMVGANTGTLSNEFAPFGGIKQSGIGREGSKYGIDEYLEIKYTLLAGL
ncbi:NAD-dependent succinate-semialdehyde dehydrogenase [Pelistega europaea]|uniref:NAD-dependent succinate-semialdehyde dehydrogenase n=1 Tax=Pelistega europaea TaxID=106147 RepID=A0A7Y4L8G4_9BURK|nr:NAD-dependent succinate-semialdehyde dehydrogenase [Pelistega europaea]NOL48910.1 NAD-dependent succinate-semialdehyde dehydrogenase [Pelistega europaea]